MNNNVNVSTNKVINATFNVETTKTMAVNVEAQVGNGGTTDHSRLKNLDYENSGHVGFASSKELENYSKFSDLPLVARTGKYSDLEGEPTPLSNLEIEEILKN